MTVLHSKLTMWFGSLVVLESVDSAVRSPLRRWAIKRRVPGVEAQAVFVNRMPSRGPLGVCFCAGI